MKSNNLQIIYVMWLREMKRFFRAKSRVVSNLALPFFFLFTMSFGFRSVQVPDTFGGTDFVTFLVPGIIGMTMLFNSMFVGLSVLWDREFGFLKEMMVAPISRSVIVLGRVSGGVTTNLIQGILILIISFFIGFKIINPLGLILALFFMILVSIGFIGVGIIITSKMEDPQGFSLIMHFFTFPSFLLSGALFPINNFPNWLKPLSLINPLTYGVDGLRASLIGFSQFSLFLDFGILLLFDLVIIALASYLFSTTEM